MTGAYRIGKWFEFQATRTRDGGPDGSGFLVEASFTATALTGPGFVVDFAQLAPIKDYLQENYDHRNLDEVLGEDAGDNGRIAAWIEAWCRAHLPDAAVSRLEAVTVRCGRPSGSGPNDLAFAAQHRLGGLPAGHRCGREHGHTYLVSPLPGDPPLPGPVRPLVAELDRTVLNTVLQAEPTSEHLARHLVLAARSQGADLRGLQVSETASTWAQYSEA